MNSCTASTSTFSRRTRSITARSSPLPASRFAESTRSVGPFAVRPPSGIARGSTTAHSDTAATTATAPATKRRASSAAAATATAPIAAYGVNAINWTAG